MTAKAPASTASVAQELVALCREGRNLDAVNKLYSPRIVSMESSGSPDMPAEMNGTEAIRAKHEWWDANNEVHSVQVNGPLLGEASLRYNSPSTRRSSRPVSGRA